MSSTHGNKMGCWDWILGIGLVLFYLGVCNVMTSPDSNRQGGLFFGSLVVAVPLTIWFAYRRGWIGEHQPAPLPVSKTAPENLPDPKIYTITPGRLQKWEAQKARSLAETILKRAGGSATEFMIHATQEATTFRVFLHVGYLDLATMRTIVMAFYPEAKVEEASSRSTAFPLYRKYMIFKRSDSHFFFDTLRQASNSRDTDPLTTLTQAMNVLEPGETAIYSVTWWRTSNFTEGDIKRLLTQTMAEAGQDLPYYSMPKSFSEALGDGIARGIITSIKRVPRFPASEERRHKAKLSQTLYQVALTVYFDTPHAERLNWFEALTVPVRALSHPEHPLIDDGDTKLETLESVEKWWKFMPSRIVGEWVHIEDEQRQTLASNHLFFVTVDELAALWHLPHDDFTASAIRSAKGEVEMPRAMRGITDGVRLGINRFAGQEEPVYLSDKERLMHAIIAGRSGTGKSSLLHRMIADDIAKGRGVCVLDPHGSLVQAVLQASIPDERIDDVVVLDLLNAVDGREYPPPLNPFVKPEGIDDSMAADMLVAVLDKVYRDDFDVSQMASYLDMGLRTLSAEPVPTLIDISRLFDEVEYREKLLLTLDDFVLEREWQAFDEQKGGKDTSLSALMRRVRALYSNKVLRMATCHPKPLDISQLLRENRVILISFASDKLRIPEAQQKLMGAALVAQVQMAAMAGAITNPPFMFYVDEAHYFVGTNLADVLSEARKRGLGLVLATQYLKQMAGDTLDAIEGNSSTFITFEVGESDAKTLAHYMKPNFDYTDLMGLGEYTAAISMRHNNRRQPAFSLEMLLPPTSDTPERETTIRRRSITSFTPKTSEEINVWLRARYNPKKPPDQSQDDSDDDKGDDEHFQKGWKPPEA